MKRIFDIGVAALVLLVASPIILLVALMVRIWLGGPVLFRQKRPGEGGRIFSMVKFRSMTSETGIDGELLPDDQRLTRFGKFLRASSLDELPELWNVLKGEMSLVGPRPLLAEYMSLYDERQARRHEVRPGLTGWAQVNGRNSLSWDERLELDVWYVENQTFLLDLKILVQTLVVVVSRRGVSAEGVATMQRFTGSQTGSNSYPRYEKLAENRDKTSPKHDDAK